MVLMVLRLEPSTNFANPNAILHILPVYPKALWELSLQTVDHDYCAINTLQYPHTIFLY